jgi:hypothetical protein
MSTPAEITRRSRADAETADAFVLVKYSASLHATRQIRTLAERAEASGKRLVLLVPKGFRPASTLRLYMANHPDVIKLEAR